MVAATTTRAARQQPLAHAAHSSVPEPPESFWYSVKCRVLGPPLVTGQLAGERLSRPLALGVLSCDGLSSAAYGTEEILYALLPFFGLAAFTLVLPLTLLVLFGVLLVVLSYREVASVYTRAGGIYTALVVLVFAVVKFTEGAWLIVIIFPVLVFTLIRLNREYREYREEAACLADSGHDGPRAQPPNDRRRVVLLLVDDYDLATIAALKYARGLRPTALRAVHFSLDGARADRLWHQWVGAGTGIPLELIDCPDRRLAHAAHRLVTSLAAAPGTQVTVVLPRRSYPPLAGRLLHDHTADRIARVVSHVPNAAATIVPFDVRHKVETAHAKRSALAAATKPGRLTDYEWPTPPAGTNPIGTLCGPSRATVEGRLRAAEIRTGRQAGGDVLACEVTDSTGELTAVFLGRATMTNPAYELLP